MPTYRYHLTDKEVAKVKRLLAEGVPVGAIAIRFSVSPRTICYYKVSVEPAYVPPHVSPAAAHPAD